MVAAAVVLAAALFPTGQQSTDTFRKYIGVPTGRNGYEEIVAATDILNAGKFGTYYQLAEQASSQIEEATMTADEAVIWRDLKPKSLLQRRRLIAERFSRALDLLEIASQKEIFDPRKDIGPMTLYPELAGFKQVAKLIPMAAYSRFADGQTRRGIDLYVAGLDVFDRLSEGFLIQYLVGVASESIILVGIDRQLNQLSQPDAARLEAAIVKVLAHEPAVRKAIAKEYEFSKKSFDDLKPEEWTSLLAGEKTEAEKAQTERSVNRFLAADRQKIVGTAQSLLANFCQEVVRSYEGDEHDWMTFVLSPLPEGDLNSAEGIARLFAQTMAPVYTQVRTAAVLNRTRLRLMGLACGVIRYRWETGQLPVKLEDAVGTDRARDPLTHLPFELRPEGQGFKIVSKGTRETGEIAVQYVRPSNKESGPP